MEGRQQTGLADPGALQPPGRLADEPAHASNGHRWLWLSLSALLLLALAVIFALPSMVDPVKTPTSMRAPATLSPPPSAPEADNPTERERAHQGLQGYLQLRARLALENASAWGEPAWSEAAALVSAGDQKFAQRQFAAAGSDYQGAREKLQQLEADRGAMLNRALQEAAGALAANDAEAAIASFEAALLIEPEHPAATQGLAQARSRLASIRQMTQGESAEAAGDLDAALAAYLQAAQLDAHYQPASEAVQRATEQIDARGYAAAMTRALAALDKGQTGAAAEALDAAARLQPGDTAVRDARQRLQAMRTQSRLSRLRRQAAARVGAEDWPAAVAVYRKALAVDRNAAFARVGLRRAQERAKLHAQFDHYLDEPARLYSDKPLANAEQLLAAASTAPAAEPQLAAKISALSELVARASTPLTLTLRSDGATNVVVYRVGRLGRFESHQLQLPPGDYTIVGSRPGYRDVRKVISLRPGVRPAPLLVRCEEAI